MSWRIESLREELLEAYEHFAKAWDERELEFIELGHTIRRQQAKIDALREEMLAAQSECQRLRQTAIEREAEINRLKHEEDVPLGRRRRNLPESIG